MMVCKSSLCIVSIIVFTIVCCVNGSYHLKQILPDPCDLRIIETVFGEAGEYQILNASFHGTYSRIDVYNCKNDTNKCSLSVVYLYRPDLTELRSSKARKFDWYPYPYCRDNDVNSVPTYRAYDAYFESREPTVFHGIKCFKFSNYSSSITVYGDDTTGTVVGANAGNADFLYEYTREPHTLSDFAFSLKGEPACKSPAYTLSDMKNFTNACKDIPKSDSKSVDFLQWTMSLAKMFKKQN